LKYKVITRLCVLSLTLLIGHAEALIVLQQVSVPLSVVHDNNLTLTDIDKQSVWLYTAAPTYTISAVENQNRWFSTIGVRFQRSSNKEISADREDPSLLVGWNRQYENGTFNLVANYNESSTRITELRTTGLVNQDLTATTKSIAADWSRLLTERLNFTLGADLTKTSFDTAGFIGSTTKSIDSSLAYQVNEKLNTFINLAFTNFNSDAQAGFVGSNSIYSRNYLAGITYSYSSELELSAAAGVNNISSAGRGKVGRISFNYRPERYQLSGDFERANAPSNIGDFQESDRYTLGYSYALSNISTLGTNFSYIKNNSLFANKTTFLNVFYTRELSDYWQMRLSIDARKQKTDIQSANGEAAGITFIYNTPEF
jgi:hypothetical protein